MIIKKIRMVNFRGFIDKTINFDNKSVVLLSAANGIGKTTTIDAIEWCLTGSIGRLKTSFDIRSTNTDERKINTSGILKNRNSGNNKTLVYLWIDDNENKIELIREQDKDELDPSKSIVKYNGDANKASNFIKKYIGESFYNFHFCDVQKSLNIQSTKRNKLEILFDEFITNYDEQNQIVDSLSQFVKELDKKIEKTCDQKKEPEASIKLLKEQIEQRKEKSREINYPLVRFYKEENLDITHCSKEELIEQKKNLENCGYLVAEKSIRTLLENEKLLKKAAIIKELQLYYEKEEEKIKKCIEAGFIQNFDKITSLNEKIKELDKVSLKKNTIFHDIDVINKYLESDAYINYEVDKMQIENNKLEIEQLAKEIDLLNNNNKLLKLFVTLSVNKELLIEYRHDALVKNGIAFCPICGSDSFAKINENLILNEADDYIKKNGELVKIKEENKKDLVDKTETIYQELISKAEKVVKEKKENITDKLSVLIKLKDEMMPFLSDVQKWQSIETNIDIKDITYNKLEVILTSIENRILKNDKLEKENELYNKILIVLGYNNENGNLSQTYEKVRNLIVDIYEVTGFTYEGFVTKINAIESILAQYELDHYKKELEIKIEEKNKLDNDISEFSKIKQLAEKKAKAIKEIVEQLSNDEYLKIGPILSKYYKKLIRIDDNKEIQLIHENDGLSLVDEKGKNIVNVLSNGQISVFMLAYFFAGINARNKSEKFKIYFIDDLTSCMDDVNMLAFVDLLKYLMETGNTIEQLFFVTCDNRISRLLKYKMEGHGIDLKELSEYDFDEHHKNSNEEKSV